MPRPVKLNQNRDFVRLYRRGKSQVHPLLVTYCQKNRQGTLRWGITATKKVGGAVQRNRAKRLIREAFRQLEPQLAPGWDLVFVARTRTATSRVRMQQVHRAMEQQLAQLGLLTQAPQPPQAQAAPQPPGRDRQP